MAVAKIKWFGKESIVCCTDGNCFELNICFRFYARVLRRHVMLCWGLPIYGLATFDYSYCKTF